MLNNKRQYFLDTNLFCQVLFSKRNECIFEMKISSLVIYQIRLFKMIDYLIYNPTK